MDLSTFQHNPCLEEITDLLCRKTQNTDKGFYRVEVAYFLSKIASSMRAYVDSEDKGEIPINCYAIALATSGYGKGYSVNIMESDIISGFRDEFLSNTLDTVGNKNIRERALYIAAKANRSPEEVEDELKASYARAGNYIFTFDSGTGPAVKQLRNKLLLSGIGAINYQVDEVASNLLGSPEVINTFLELYDQGKVKSKLIKSTADQVRDLDIDGKTPANMLLFGTPVKLFDGGTTEEYFYSMLDTGYARRCLFGLGLTNDKKAYYAQSAEEIYAALTEPKNKEVINKWYRYFTDLANPSMYNWGIKLNKEEAITLLEYKAECEKQADTLSLYADIEKAELSHRYFKAQKLAGTFAFIDKAKVISKAHIEQAIKLVEESGENFKKILNREKPYMKLAKYLSSSDEELTHADLTEALPFYKGTLKTELMSLAMAWGYKNNIIIKKSFSDGVEFFKGESLEETDLNNLIISYSDHWAYNYVNTWTSLEKLATKLFQREGMHWCSHHFIDGHRCNENVKPKFNLVVLDIDGGTTIEVAENLLKDYCYIIYTTKSHTPKNHRFRLILPIKYTLSFDLEEYREFIKNILNWLPIKSDKAADEISKKWESYAGGELRTNYNGSILDPTMFIPNTLRNDTFIMNQKKKIGSFDNLERWFTDRYEQGGRNNLLLKFALCLVDSDLEFDEISARVLSFNRKFKDKLSDIEVTNTILVTAKKHWLEKRESS